MSIRITLIKVMVKIHDVERLILKKKRNKKKRKEILRGVTTPQ